jgi:hypothetical protein
MKLTACFVALFLLCAGSLHALNTEGLVLYLPFDEGSGKEAKDASGNGNDGKLEGNVEWVDGKHGKAIRVSDDAAGNMVVVKDDDTLDVTDQITMAAWVYIESMPDNHCSIITKANTYMIHTSLWSGKGIEMEPLLWPFDAWQTPASVPIQFKEWHHIVGVYDGNEIRTYIDGELKGKRARSGEIAVTQADVVIGRDSRSCCNSRRAAQIIDEVMIWSRAISENEVKEIMAGVTPVQPNDLLTTMWGRIKARY